MTDLRTLMGPDLFGLLQASRTERPALTVVTDSSVEGETRRKELRDHLADCLKSCDGPADPRARARWLAEHEKGR